MPKFGMMRRPARVRAAGLALGLSFAATCVTSVAPSPAGANPFVYRPGYQRMNRYVYRGRAWLRIGYYSAAAPGFYPSLGYLGFAPPPIYAVPLYPAYAYPAPYYYPAVPYAIGRPAVPIYYGPPAGYAMPYGSSYTYGYAYRRAPGRVHVTFRPAYANTPGGYPYRSYPTR